LVIEYTGLSELLTAEMIRVMSFDELAAQLYIPLDHEDVEYRRPDVDCGNCNENSICGEYRRYLSLYQT
jgi:hypothetical protein